MNLKPLFMKTHFLFPNKYKKIGWILFILGIALHVYATYETKLEERFMMKVFALIDDGINSDGINSNYNYFTFIQNSILDELYFFLIIVGGLLVSFSKLKVEDEFIAKIRYESLVWATYLNYGLILFFTLFVYGLSYINVLFYNTFTLLLFFIVRFHFMIYKLNKSGSDDE